MADEHIGWSSVPNWVIRSSKLHGSEKLLYIALLNRANAKGECWPSLATLTKEVGVSNRTIIRKLDDLESKGLIKKTRRAKDAVGQISNLYKVFAFNTAPPCDILSPPSDNEHQAPGAICHPPSDNEHHEVLPSEVLPIRSTTQSNARDIEALFDHAYSRWPKKDKRKESLAKFQRACKTRDPNELVADIIRFGDAYAATTEVQYVPALVVWLNGERWTDALPQPRGRNTQQVTRADEAHDFISRLEAIDATRGGGAVVGDYPQLRQ